MEDIANQFNPVHIIQTSLFRIHFYRYQNKSWTKYPHCSICDILYSDKIFPHNNNCIFNQYLLPHSNSGLV